MLRSLSHTTALDADEWNVRHRLVVLVLAAHLPALAVFGALQDVDLGHLLTEVVVTAAPLVVAVTVSGRVARALSASLGLMVCSAVLVHFSGGTPEAHFHYFVALALVAVYQEWRVYAAAMIFVLVQHGVFSVFDADSVFGHVTSNQWGLSLLHTLAVGALSAVLVVFWSLNERTQRLRLEAEAGRAANQRRVAQLVRESPVGICRLELDGRCLEANPALVRLLGRSDPELVGTELTAFAHPGDAVELDVALQRVIDVDESGLRREVRFVHANGDVVWTLVTVSVLRDEHGRAAWLLAHLQDITESMRTGEARLRVALDAAGMGTWDWDLHSGQVRGSDVVARMFGLERMDAQRDEVMSRVHPDDRARVDAAHRRAISEHGVLDEQFRVVHDDGAHRWVSVRASVLTGPDGEPSLVIGVCQDRTQVRADEEERSALITAQQRAADLAVRLQQLTAALAEARTVEQVARTLEGAARRMPGVPVSQVVVLDGELGLRRVGDPEHRPVDESFRDAARSGQPVWLPTASTGRDRYPGSQPAGACVVLPLVSHGQTVGAWGLCWPRDRAFSAEEERFLGTAASLAATTMERARLYDEQREVAELLQRSLLPQRLPQLAGVQSAARYRIAGGPGSEVGGDWYDVLPLTEGRVGVVVGDVSGHGIRAASLMGQLRSTLRAYALEDRCPAEVLAAVNRALPGLDVVDPEKLVTVTYAILDPDRGRLSYSRAGHPPMLLVTADGQPVLLDEAGGLPLGVAPEAEYAVASVPVDPGARLLGYTDGLVERRGEPLDGGLARLTATVAGSGQLGLDELLDLLVARLPSPGHDDDVTLVGVALATVPMPKLTLTLPARYDQLPPLRERLAAWLSEAGADRDEAQALVLLASESVTNAIEDASSASPDVHLTAAVTGEQVCVTVNSERRLTGHRGIDRGRGLMLIEALAERLELRHTEDGTEVRICGPLRAALVEPAEIRLP